MATAATPNPSSQPWRWMKQEWKVLTPIAVQILIGVGVAVWINVQSVQTQLRLAEIKGVQDQQIEQVKRQLDAPHLTTHVAPTDVTLFGITYTQLANGSSSDLNDFLGSSEAQEIERQLSKQSVAVLNGSGPKAAGIRLDVQTPRPVDSAKPRFPHEDAIVKLSPDKMTLAVSLDNLPSGDELIIDVFLVPSPGHEELKNLLKTATVIGSIGSAVQGSTVNGRAESVDSGGATLTLQSASTPNTWLTTVTAKVVCDNCRE